MLVLTRKTEQQIQIGPHITITILKVKGQTVRVGIQAPRDICVLRSELSTKRAGKVVEASDPATLDSALAATRREQARSSYSNECVEASDTGAPQATLMRYRVPRGSALGGYMSRDRGRLMQLATPPIVADAATMVDVPGMNF